MRPLHVIVLLVVLATVWAYAAFLRGEGVEDPGHAGRGTVRPPSALKADERERGKSESQVPGVKDRTLTPTPSFPEQSERIVITLARVHAGDPAREHTLVHVGNTVRPAVLPVGWKSRIGETETRIAAYDKAIHDVERDVTREVRAHGEGDGMQGYVARVGPDGMKVPPGDVVEMLNVLLRVGLREITLHHTRGARWDPPKLSLAVDLTLASDGIVQLGEDRFDVDDRVESREGAGSWRELKAALASALGSRDGQGVRLTSEWGAKWRFVKAVMDAMPGADAGRTPVVFHVKPRADESR